MGGYSKDYLGKNLSASDIEKLSDEEVVKFYGRYEAYIGGTSTKLLKKSICIAFSKAAKLLIPSVSDGRVSLSDSDGLAKSLDEDPTINMGLNLFVCKINRDYGHLLAPLSAILLTSDRLTVVENSHEPEKEPEKLNEEPEAIN